MKGPEEAAGFFPDSLPPGASPQRRAQPQRPGACRPGASPGSHGSWALPSQAPEDPYHPGSSALSSSAPERLPGPSPAHGWQSPRPVPPAPEPARFPPTLPRDVTVCLSTFSPGFIPNSTFCLSSSVIVGRLAPVRRITSFRPAAARAAKSPRSLNARSPTRGFRRPD